MASLPSDVIALLEKMFEHLFAEAEGLIRREVPKQFGQMFRGGKIDGSHVTIAIPATTSLPATVQNRLGASYPDGTTIGITTAGEIYGIPVADVDPPQVAVALSGSVTGTEPEINFIPGTGISISETDHAGSRVDVVIGSTAGTGTLTAISDTSVLTLTLWNGASNNSPPAGWETTGYSDAAWTAAYITPDEASLYITGAHMIWHNPQIPTSVGQEQILTRHHFVLPVGSLLSAVLTYAMDSILEGMYVNGTAVGGTMPQTWASGLPLRTVDVSAQLVTGAANVLAIWAMNDNNPTDPGGNVCYKLVVSYVGGGAGTGETIQQGGAVVDTRPILNFTGAGVVVTDDPSNNRVNVAIAGGGGGSGGAYAPLCNGDVPGPTPIATVDGQYIMVPL